MLNRFKELNIYILDYLARFLILIRIFFFRFVKLLIVVDYNHIFSGSIGSIQMLFGYLRKLLARLKPFQNSICFVVSSVDNPKDDRHGYTYIKQLLATKMKSFRSELQKRLSTKKGMDANLQEMLMLCDIFLSQSGKHYSNFDIFMRPVKTGKIIQLPQIRYVKTNIMKIIEQNIEYAKTTDNSFFVRGSSTSNIGSDNLTDKMIDSLYNQINACIKETYEKIFPKTNDTENSNHEMETYEQNVHNFLDKLEKNPKEIISDIDYHSKQSNITLNEDTLDQAKSVNSYLKFTNSTDVLQKKAIEKVSNMKSEIRIFLGNIGEWSSYMSHLQVILQ